MKIKKKAVKKVAAAPLTELAGLLAVTSDRATWRNTVMRVRYIHEEIRRGKYPNCPKLAKHFGVSIRTIYRDIEAMRGIPDLEIEFSVARNGYYYTREVPADLPRPKLTSGEALAFCLAIRALERFRGTDFAELFERSLRKIMDEVEGEVAFEWQALDALVSFGPRGMGRLPVVDEIAAAVSDGLVRQRELVLLYRKLDGAQYEKRRIQPLHLRAHDDVLFIYALDPQRGDGKVRSFVLSRMKEVRVSKREFVRPEDFDPYELMKHSVGAYGGTEPVRVRLRLSAMAARFLEERPLHPTQKIVWARKKGEDAELRMNVALTPELEQKILYWGLDAEVLEPAGLRERIAEIGRVLAGRR